jgi:hypothetical protein
VRFILELIYHLSGTKSVGYLPVFVLEIEVLEELQEI